MPQKAVALFLSICQTEADSIFLFCLRLRWQRKWSLSLWHQYLQIWRGVLKDWWYRDLRLSVQGKKIDLSFGNSLMRIQIRNLALQAITWQFISLHGEKSGRKAGLAASLNAGRTANWCQEDRVSGEMKMLFFQCFIGIRCLGRGGCKLELVAFIKSVFLFILHSPNQTDLQLKIQQAVSWSDG